MPKPYWDRLSGVQGILESTAPSGQGMQAGVRQPSGGEEAMSEALRQALVRRAQENLDDIGSERLVRGKSMPGIGQLLVDAPSNPRLTQILMDRGVLTPEGLQREKLISARQQRIQQGPGVAGTMEPLGSSGLRVQPGEAQSGLGQIQDPILRQKLMEVLGGQRSAHSPGLWLDRLASNFR